MDNPIYNLIERIKEVNEIVASRSDFMLSFEDCYKISQFYFEFQNTNRLIDEAERLAEENLTQLKDLAGLLKEKSAHLIDNLKMIKDVDFISIADKQTSLFYDCFQKAADELNPYWKRYGELNNRLDYLLLDSKEYVEGKKNVNQQRQSLTVSLHSTYRILLITIFTSINQKVNIRKRSAEISFETKLKLSVLRSVLLTQIILSMQAI